MMLRRILATSTALLTVAAGSSLDSGCSSGGSGTTGSSSSSSGGEVDSSSGSGSSSGGTGGDGGADLCTSPLSSVAASMIPPYMAVSQQVGACAPADLSGFITACDSTGATDSTCGNWFSGAPPSCEQCLIGPLTGSDPGSPTGQGGIWLDYQGDNIGANVPGCLDKQGMSACATAYQNLLQCILAAGCIQCTDQNSFGNCQTAVAVSATGACHSYVAPYQSSCAADIADGGLINGGICSTDLQVLSVICGNGSGDGG